MNSRVLIFLCLATSFVGTLRAQYTEGITVIEPRAKAWTPQQELKSIEMDGPYEAQLVACEPLVHDPVEVTWDAQGRCFVADMMDYPLGPPEGQKPLSRIVQLLDPDKDGRYTKSKVFAEHVDHVQGLLPYKDGLIATTRTEVLFLRDTNGDGVADEIKPLIEGFNPSHSQLQVSAPRWGLDNCVHFNNGLNTKEIYPAADPAEKVNATRCNLRWDPATGKVEPTSGYGQYGGCFDDWGRQYFCSNRNPVMMAVMPYKAVIRNPHAGIAQGWEDIAPTGGETRVYPLQLTHTTADAHAGTHTAACGLGVYRGDLMPELRGEIFVCEPTAQSVVRYHPEPNGVSLKATRVGDHTEFFRSHDEWCRPVNVTTGPDGALYVCDIYRRFIDHARFFPEAFVKSHDMRAGSNEGRIWRIVRRGQQARAIGPAPKGVDELVAWLGHPNAWQRETAQRLLLEMKPEEVKGVFAAIARKTESIPADMKKLAQEEGASPMPLRIDLLPQVLRDEIQDFVKKNPGQNMPPAIQQKIANAANSHSMSQDLPVFFMMHWTNLVRGLVLRNGLEKLQPAEKVSAGILPDHEADLDAPPWILRRHGANFFEHGLEAMPLDARGQFVLLDDDHAKDAKQLVSVITHTGKLIGTTVFSYVDDVWMQRAILSNCENKAGAVLAGVLGDAALMKTYSPLRPDFIRSLASCSAADADAADVAAMLAALRQDAGRIGWWKPALLQGLAEGLPKSKKKLGVSSFAEFTARPPPQFKEAAAEIAALLAKVDAVMTDPAAPLDDRLAVIPLVAQRSWDKAEPVMRTLLLAENQQSDITQAALAVLRKFSTDKTAPLLYELLPRLSPAPRREAVAMLSTGKMSLDFLHRMDRGEISKSLVGAEQRWGFQHSGSAEIKELALKLFGTVSSDRAAVITAYAEATKKKGDAQKGHQIFQTICIACHKIRGEGVDVGPDITDVRIKPADALLTDILDPNRIVEPRFMAYQVDTKDGRVVSGIVATESDDAVTLKLAGGVTESVPRANIKAMKCLDQSLMPVGLEGTISKEQMSDLLAFLKGE